PRLFFVLDEKEKLTITNTAAFYLCADGAEKAMWIWWRLINPMWSGLLIYCSICENSWWFLGALWSLWTYTHSTVWPRLGSAEKMCRFIDPGKNSFAQGWILIAS